MGKKAIGVKFCGGCNPTFDRGAKYKELKERFPNAAFETYKEGKEYDNLLLICGCERVCLRQRDEFNKDCAVTVGCAEDMDRLEF